MYHLKYQIYALCKRDGNASILIYIPSDFTAWIIEDQIGGAGKYGLKRTGDGTEGQPNRDLYLSIIASQNKGAYFS